MFAATVLFLGFNAYADLGSSATSKNGDTGGSSQNSCQTPPVDNITLTGYSPGCSSDSGDDAATPGGLKPSKFKLDGNSSKVVLAAAPMRMPSCASKCYKYIGGKPDDGISSQLTSNLSQKTFYFDDLCPGCKKKKKSNGRIDLAMSCKTGKGKKVATDFRVLMASLKPVPCTEEVMAEIDRVKGGSQYARQPAASQEANAGR